MSFRVCFGPKDMPFPWQPTSNYQLEKHPKVSHHGPPWGNSDRLHTGQCPCGPSARAEVVCHSLLQWTTFHQNSPPWPVSLGWPYMTHCFIELDKVGIPVISLFSFPSWWDGLAVGKTGSCSGGQGHIQKVFNPIFCWWVGLCSLPAVSPEAKQWRGNGSNVDLLQKGLYQRPTPPKTAVVSDPDPEAGHCQPIPLPETPRHSHR